MNVFDHREDTHPRYGASSRPRPLGLDQKRQRPPEGWPIYSTVWERHALLGVCRPLCRTFTVPILLVSAVRAGFPSSVRQPYELSLVLQDVGGHAVTYVGVDGLGLVP